jgi:putative ABC transport system permease protein
MALVVRAESDPMSCLGAIRAQVLAVDSEQTVFDVYTMDQVMADSVRRRRFTVQLLGLFSAVAIALALIGIYGVMSYSVNQRIHEIGIRMALGAHRSEVLRLTLGWSLKWVLAGTAIGLVTGLGLTRFIAGQLYEVRAADPAVLAAVSMLLIAAGTLAAYLPAQRASRVEPVAALRHE